MEQPRIQEAPGRDAGEIQNQGQRRATSRVIEVPPSTPSSNTSLGAAVSPAPQANQRIAQPRRYPTVEEQGSARAVPRGTVQPAPRSGTSSGAYVYGRPTTRIYNNYYYYPRHYYPYGYGSYGLGFFYYDPYSWYDSYPYYSNSYPYYSSYPSPAYGGGIYQYRHGYATGEIRLQVRPRWAEVYVDGYYAGRVDDFDGFIQALRIEEGPHTIEIVAAGYETLVFDVRIIPGRKIDYRGDMIPYRP